MSKEKLYAIKNDDGEWADTRYVFGYGAWVTPDKAEREEYVKYHGGHVVTLIEEPKKVAVPVWFDEFVQKYEDNLSNEEMARLRIIGKVCQSGWGTTFNSQLNRDIPDEFNPFDLDDYQLCYVNEHKDELVHALSLNSWTVVKEKKYLVELDGLVTTDGAKQYLTNKNGKWFASRRMSGLHQDFTDKELNAAPEWAQQLNREEVTDDEQ